MKILLISPKCSDRPPEIYNVGLACIASALREDGHEISLIDLNAHRYTKEQALQLVRAYLTRDDYQAVGMGSLITTYNHIKWLCGEIKKIRPNIPIWVGNSIASSIPELLLRTTQADVAVIGEGEITAKELAKITAQGGDLDTVAGIYYKKNGKIVKTPPRPLVEDLDTLPRPAYDLFDQEIYMKGAHSVIGERVFCVGVSIRGCPHHCTYCYHAYHGTRIRCQSARRMIDDISYAKSKYDFDGFGWTDDTFTANHKRLYEFCDLLKREKINAQWGCTARVNDITEDLLKRMKSAGCVWLGFGIESGSQKILDIVKKGVKAEQAKKAIVLCKKVGIIPGISLMINNVGETRETVQETVSFIKEVDCPPPSFHITTPYPGTELYEYAKSKGYIKDELSLIQSYGEQSETLLVNFTEFTDTELIQLKQETERLMYKNYLERHPLFPLKIKKDRAFYVIRRAFYLIRKRGVIITFFKGVQLLIGKVTGNQNIRCEFLCRHEQPPDQLFLK